jgi:hypothetical protein
MILEVCWDGLWTLSFRLSQFYGHGSWLVCEVALSETQTLPWTHTRVRPKYRSNTGINLTQILRAVRTLLSNLELPIASLNKLKLQACIEKSLEDQLSLNLWFILDWSLGRSRAHLVRYLLNSSRLKAALHLEAGPIPLEANCMKFQPFLGWRPASTTHYNRIITGANFPICKGLRAKELGRFNKSSIIQRISHNLA